MGLETGTRPGEVPGGIDLNEIAKIGGEEEKKMAERLMKVREGRQAEAEMAPRAEKPAAVTAAPEAVRAHQTVHPAQEISQDAIKEALAKVEAAGTPPAEGKPMAAAAPEKSFWKKIFG
jgi:hypothetical protein